MSESFFAKTTSTNRKPRSDTLSAPQMLETWKDEIEAFSQLARDLHADVGSQQLDLPNVEKTDQVC